MPDRRITLVVADDHPLFLEGLVSALAAVSDFDVIASATDGEEAIRMIETHVPDVAVLDLHMPAINGIEVTRRAAQASPTTRILVLTMVDTDQSIQAAMRAGAKGYVLKGAERKEIVQAIQTLASGGVAVSQAVADRLVARGSVDSAQLPGLSARELEIARLIGDGLTNPAIAERLHLSAKTVRNYVSNVMIKLNAETRQDVARRLAEHA